MRFIIATVVLFATIPAAFAEDCKAIQEPAARLACFDKPLISAAKPGAPKSPLQAKKGGGVDSAVATDAGWELRIIKDGFSDRISCVITPTGRPWVKISVGNLYISYQGRGGVEGFTARIDENPPGQMQLPTPIDKSVGTVHFKGPAFFDVMAGDRLRVQTFTVLRELKDEDLHLEGAKRLYKKMGPECEH